MKAFGRERKIKWKRKERKKERIKSFKFPGRDFPVPDLILAHFHDCL